MSGSHSKRKTNELHTANVKKHKLDESILSKIVQFAGPHFSTCKANGLHIPCECPQTTLRNQLHPSLDIPANQLEPLKHLNGYVVLARCELDTLPLACRYPHWRDFLSVFDEKPHYYYLKGRKVGISCTGFIGYFHEHFDSTGAINGMINNPEFPQAEKYVKYRELHLWIPEKCDIGVDEQIKLDMATFMEQKNPRYVPKVAYDGINILAPWQPGLRMTPNLDVIHKLIEAQWEDNRLQASELGTHMHLCCELFLNEQFDDPRVLHNTSPEFNYFKQFDEDMRKEGWVIYRTEQTVWSEELDLCGNVDAQYQRIEDVDLPVSSSNKRIIMLVDWKRSKLITLQSSEEDQRKQRFRKKMMVAPLDHLEDCNGSHYWLQVGGVYKNLLEQFNDVIVIKCLILQFFPAFDGYQKFEVPNMDKEWQAMALHRKRQLAGEISIPPVQQ